MNECSLELISICKTPCHGVCVMKRTKSVSFISVGHFCKVNCLNLYGAVAHGSSRLIKTWLTTSGQADDSQHRLIADDAIVSVMQIFNWNNFRLGVKDLNLIVLLLIGRMLN